MRTCIHTCQRGRVLRQRPLNQATAARTPPVEASFIYIYIKKNSLSLSLYIYINIYLYISICTYIFIHIEIYIHISGLEKYGCGLVL